MLMLMLLFLLFSFCDVTAENVLKYFPKKMKMKVRGEWTEQNNGGNTHRKYAIRGSNGTYPLLFLLLFLLLSFLCFCCGDCFLISAEQQWNWRLALNKQNKITAETIVINMPSGDWTALTLFCCCFCFCYFLFYVVAAEIVWIKIVPLNI